MSAVRPDIFAGQDLLHLSVGEIHALAEPGGALAITCTRCAAWVTQEGLGEDVVLETGESFRPREHGKVVVQALEDAAIRIT